MSLFTSNRERRLWVWTLAVVVAIYSTLGLTGTLAGFWHKYGLQEISFIFGAFLIVAAIVAQGLKARPGGAEIAVALGVAAAYLMVFVRMSIPEERTHLIEYGEVVVFIFEALTERASPVGQPSNGAARLIHIHSSDHNGLITAKINAEDFKPNQGHELREGSC